MSTNKKAKFLHLLADLGNITLAALGAGLGRRTVYGWRKKDPDFAAAWDDALEIGADALEDEARRRAMAGSDLLLIFLLKGAKPHIYRERPWTLPPMDDNSVRDLARDLLSAVRAIEGMETQPELLGLTMDPLPEVAP
jgi:hypothetical protein